MAKLEQIQTKIKQLQAQADALLAKKVEAAVDQIRGIMLQHGLTTADIEAHVGAAKVGAKRGPKPGAKRAGKTTRTAVTKKAAPQTKGKLPPKYINPKTGETWSGHARPPAWIGNVKDRTKFLIANGADTAVATSADAVSKAKGVAKKASAAAGAVARKGQRKGPQPALYRDPKSGSTWSGRGRAPAWLASSKDRSEFLIDGASTAADAKPAVAKAVGKKAPTAKKTAAKKAVSAKVPAKKAPAKKAPRKSAAVPSPVASVESGAELTT